MFCSLLVFRFKVMSFKNRTPPEKNGASSVVCFHQQGFYTNRFLLFCSYHPLICSVNPKSSIPDYPNVLKTLHGIGLIALVKDKGLCFFKASYQ